jgi:hypothetical protein
MDRQQEATQARFPHIQQSEEDPQVQREIYPEYSRPDQFVGKRKKYCLKRYIVGEWEGVGVLGFARQVDKVIHL